MLTGMFTTGGNAYYNADGEQMNYFESGTKWFQAAFDSLAEGEIMICFHNDGNKAGVENYNKALAELKDPAVYGQKVTLTGFEFSAPACQHTNTKVEGAVEATCTEPGFTGNTVCADCGEQITAGTEIAVVDHTFEAGVCTVCGAEDPNYEAPVVDLVIGDNAINGEDITFAYTATEDGTLALSLKSAFSSIRDYCNIYYGINDAELAAYEQNAAIALVKGDVVTIFVEANCKRTMVATWTKTEAPVVEDKTITIGDKTFTTVDGKWAFNQEMTAANSTKYNMIIMTKAFTGSFATNGYGVAIVLDQYGTLVRVYDGANVGYWTVDGKAASAHFGANDYAITAWNELQEGETLVVFTHTGSEGNVARQFGLNVRSLCGKTAALTGFEFAAAPCKHTNTKVEGAVEATCEEKGHTGKTVCADCGETVDEGTEIAALGHNYVDGVCTNCNNPKTFDVFGIMVAVMATSGTALVCLKKKED